MSTPIDPRNTYVCKQSFGAANGRQVLAGQRLKGSDAAVQLAPELFELAVTITKSAPKG